MKKTNILIIILAMSLLLLAGCKKEEVVPNEEVVSSTSDLPSEQVDDGSIDKEWDTKGYFIPQKATTTTIETYKICEGTEVENEITVLTAKEDGPTVFIVAGQHGDEIAGYMAIDKLKDMELKSGKVLILSPANKLGATAEPKTRYVKDKEDLNRSFPGSEDGTSAELLASAIYSIIEEEKPVIVLDHHEARVIKTDRDFLGSSFIYTSLEGMEDLFLDMYQATHDRELCAEPYKFFSPGPSGSMNSVVATNLKIPVITIETFRGYALERRIEEHIAIAGYILRYYEMM